MKVTEVHAYHYEHMASVLIGGYSPCDEDEARDYQSAYQRIKEYHEHPGPIIFADCEDESFFTWRHWRDDKDYLNDMAGTVCRYSILLVEEDNV